MLNNNKKALIWGGVFGFVAPFIGLFVGLQLSPTIANILMFPVLLLSEVLNSPFGTWSPGFMLAGLLVSMAAWALVFAAVSALVKRVQK